MKRKRGHKKGKQKKTSAVNNMALDVDDNPVLDDFGDENDDDAQLDSNMEVDVPAFVLPKQPATFTNPNTDGLTDRLAGRPGIGRVKVKLKSSKLIDHQRTQSDVPAQSDTDKSSQHLSLEKQGEVEKTDDSGNSLPETQSAVSEKVPRKTGTLKIKSSRGAGSLSTVINLTSSPAGVQGVRNTQTSSDNDKTVDSSVSRESQQREHKLPQHESRYNEQELNAALMVIKKIMKMDAAEPFNIPVNPEALGIPDYFEIIHYPMDFGTVCNNLEHGNRYMNSKDVFKDVQYIWENCYKYNNKGDYIVDLMKRVKKNFMKYWTAAGLYVEQLRINGPSESIQVDNVSQSSQEKMLVKGTPAEEKPRRRHGIRQHKSNCLCAVCVIRRKRKERERNAQALENQIEISDGNLSQDLKQEETAGTPFSENASSNLEPYPDRGAAIYVEEQGEEMKSEKSEQQQDIPLQDKQVIRDNEVENQSKDEGEPSEALQIGNGSGEEPKPQSGSHHMEDLGWKAQLVSQKSGPPLQQKQEELRKRNQQIEMYKKLFGDENPWLMELCSNLFPGDPKSVWSGPHSLTRHNVSVQSSSGIHAALATFMK